MLALGKIQDVEQQVVLAGSVWLPASSDLLASCQTFLARLRVFVQFFGHWPWQRKGKQQMVVSAGLSEWRKDLYYQTQTRAGDHTVLQFIADHTSWPDHSFSDQDMVTQAVFLALLWRKWRKCCMTALMSKTYCHKYWPLCPFRAGK